MPPPMNGSSLNPFRHSKRSHWQPGFAALIEDRRPLVRIAGEDPVTVADLAQALQKKFFHGVDRAAEGGRINARKHATLEDQIGRAHV